MSSFRGLTLIRQILTLNSETWLCVYKRKGQIWNLFPEEALYKKHGLAFHPLPRGKVLFTKPTPLKRIIRYVNTDGPFWCWAGTFRLGKYKWRCVQVGGRGFASVGTTPSLPFLYMWVVLPIGRCSLCLLSLNLFESWLVSTNKTW